MAGTVNLKASDGHEFAAYEANPDGKPRGGLVLVQEIFGVNAHIRRVADGFSADGYHVVAPALFDRAERGAELGYDGPDRDKGVALRQRIALDDMLRDIAAAGGALTGAGNPRIAIVGYCLGGSLAWMTATRLVGFAAAVGYYGGMIAGHLGGKPRCPVMLHFGEEDHGIPLSDVDKIKAAVDPGEVRIFTYPQAGHAFNRQGSAAWHEPSARLACERTLAFLQQHVG